MAKVKNKRNSGLANKVHTKRKADINKKKINPFEVHVNKEKLKVLGKKSKHDRGLPGVSRAKAIQKRKETLGTELKLMNKTNTFIDRRIGEKNSQLSAEDRMIARFAAERVKQHGKKNIYSLADDEVLTHRGQTLEQIEKFDDPKSSDDEDEDRKKFGGLDNDFVSEGHFGGGMLSTSQKDGAKSHKDLIEQLIAESKKRKAEKQKEKEQTLDLTEKLDSEWRDLQPVVFKAAREVEKEKEKESIIDKLLGSAEKRSEDYDKMTRELRFEKRGTASDGLKSDEKQAKEERQRLEQLERERQERMIGETGTAAVTAKTTAPKHRSAEDLDDNFELDDNQEFMLAYDKDGKPLVPEHILKDYSVPNAKLKFSEDVSDTSSDDDGDDELSDDEGHNKSSNSESKEGNEKLDADSDEDEGENNESLEMEVNSDILKPLEDKKASTVDLDIDQNEESDTDSDEDDEESIASVEKRVSGKISKSHKGEKDQAADVDSDQEISDDDTQEKKETKEISKKNKRKLVDINTDDQDKKTELAIPEKRQKKDSAKKMEESILFQNQNGVQNSDDESSEGEYGDNSDSENDGNRSKPKTQRDTNNFDDLNDLKVSDEESDDETVEEDNTVPLFDLQSDMENLTELLKDKNPSQQSTIIQNLIKKYDPSLSENNKDLLSKLFAHMLQYVNDIFKNLKNEGEILKSFLIFDKLAPLFYDLTHKVKVSTKNYLAQLLKEKHDKFKRNSRTVPDLDTLIFFKLVSLLYPTSDFRHPITTPCMVFMSEILALSKFNNAYSISRGLFLTALILEYTVMSKRFVPSAVNFLRGMLYLSANISILNPVQVVPPFKLHKDVNLLKLDHDCSKMEVDHKMAAKDLVTSSIDDEFKVRSLVTTTLMLKEFFNHFNELEAQECIFEPHINLCSRLDLDLYPKKVSSTVNKVVQHMKESLEVKTYTPMTVEKKKPKALRLYEPDIQEVFTGSKSSKLPREQAERARLQNKVKKEMKGALREIRRDKAYIAGVKIRQKIHSDNIRKEKVKQIYKDASIQQGELNKLKRMK